MSRNILTLCFLALVMVGLSACNTARGFGQDLSGAGDTIQGVFD